MATSSHSKAKLSGIIEQVFIYAAILHLWATLLHLVLLMLISLLEEDGQEWLSTYTVCIIGTGIAGYEVARRLAMNPAYRILMLESGDQHFNPLYQQLNQQAESARKTRVSQKGSFYSVENASRIRQLGGTLSVWSGKWKPLEPYDFTPKAGYEPLNWPIAFSELLPYYHRTLTDYQLAATNPDAFLAVTEGSVIKSTHYHQQEPALQLNDRLRELSKQANVTILYQATVSELLVTERGTIKAARIRRIDHKTYLAFAQVYILATGGIENARILLNTHRIAAQLPAIGKYYMDHPKGMLATLPSSPLSRQLRPANSLALLEQRSFLGLSTRLLETFHLPNHSFALLAEPPAAVSTKGSPLLLYQKSKRNVKRLACQVLGRNRLSVFFHLEQLPSATSYVSLAPDRDVLGIPKARLHWTFTDEEQKKLLVYLDVLNRNLQAAYGLTLHYDRQTIHIDQTGDASHHMGTTRMGSRSIDSVVDSNCQVHGIANLFVAGSSVFSTAGNANPTLTIAALAARLGDYLDRKAAG